MVRKLDAFSVVHFPRVIRSAADGMVEMLLRLMGVPLRKLGEVDDHSPLHDRLQALDGEDVADAYAASVLPDGGEANSRFNLEGAMNPEPWTESLDHAIGPIVLRRMPPDAVSRRQLVATELQAGRPVGLLLWERDPDSEAMHEIGWVAIRINEIKPYIFLDAVRLHPDSGQCGGLFTERRVLRFDNLPESRIADLIYCEEITPRLPHRRRGRPKKRRF